MLHYRRKHQKIKMVSCVDRIQKSSYDCTAIVSDVKCIRFQKEHIASRLILNDINNHINVTKSPQNPTSPLQFSSLLSLDTMSLAAPSQHSLT